MRKSRLVGFVIDCKTDDLDAAAAFWGRALGYEVKRSMNAPESKYRTDDIEAEAQRLEKLGAKRIEKVRTWWVMEAPTGQRFCVVQPQRADFAKNANQYDP